MTTAIEEARKQAQTDAVKNTSSEDLSPQALFSKHFVEPPEKMPREFVEIIWVIDKMLALGQLTDKEHKLAVYKIRNMFMTLTMFGKEYQPREALFESLIPSQVNGKDKTWEFSPKFLLDMEQAEFTIWFQLLRSKEGRERDLQAFRGTKTIIEEIPSQKKRGKFGGLFRG